MAIRLSAKKQLPVLNTGITIKKQLMKNDMTMLMILALGGFAVWQASKAKPAKGEPVAGSEWITQPKLTNNPNPYAKALADAIAAGFTAKSSELEAVANAMGRDSAEYQGAIDAAYQEVADNLRPGEVVAWSSARGYYAVSEKEAATWNGY